MEFKNYSVEIISNIGDLIKSKENLSKENNELKKELNLINSKLLLSQILLRENNELKTLLGRKEENQKFILANVLAKPNLSPYDSLILDVGEGYGIKKGDKVIVNNNVVIGELEDVYLKTSKVRLFSFLMNFGCRCWF